MIDADELTVEILESLKPGETISYGAIEDSPLGYHANGTGKLLHWIARRGEAPDWAIYCHLNEVLLHTQGDKIKSSPVIRRLVPCTDEALARYRR